MNEFMSIYNTVIQMIIYGWITMAIIIGVILFKCIKQVVTQRKLINKMFESGEIDTEQYKFLLNSSPGNRELYLSLNVQNRRRDKS